MQKRKLGKSNLEVSAIAFGCMGLNFNSGVLTMNTIFDDVCVLVAAAFALTLVPGFRLRPAHAEAVKDESQPKISG
jgi:hypothetical protein